MAEAIALNVSDGHINSVIEAGKDHGLVPALRESTYSVRVYLVNDSDGASFVSQDPDVHPWSPTDNTKFRKDHPMALWVGHRVDGSTKIIALLQAEFYFQTTSARDTFVQSINQAQLDHFYVAERDDSGPVVKVYTRKMDAQASYTITSVQRDSFPTCRIRWALANFEQPMYLHSSKRGTSPWTYYVYTDDPDYGVWKSLYEVVSG